ncbi:uncharacterized protein RJT20DRAFT_128379 [Scheffersomyces xylosifermentans]|uniref:uncharacterized protein n=1 Tax=Scheffersomyces xylosifermentans TaxID=1304137 RepID=UPI00315CBBF9
MSSAFDKTTDKSYSKQRSFSSKNDRIVSTVASSDNKDKKNRKDRMDKNYNNNKENDRKYGQDREYHDYLTRLASSVIEVEAESDLRRNQINDTLKLAESLYDENRDLDNIRHSYKEFTFLTDEDEPPSAHAITSLSLQLNRLRIMNLAMKNEGIQRSNQLNKERISKLSEEIAQTKDKVARSQDALEEKKKSMEQSYEKASAKVDVNARAYPTKLHEIERQLVRMHRQRFIELKEMTFSRGPKNELYFHHQPILRLELFRGQKFSTHISHFLENLIILQRNLATLFGLELPYLTELTKMLPGEEFFNAVKQKVNDIMEVPEEDDKESEEEIEYEKRNSTDDNSQSHDDNGNAARVIKLGEELKLPLSSKTINSQRRASLMKSPEPITEIPVIKERSLSPTKSASPSMGAGNKKNLIIIPHIILNKPFSSLTIYEFQKFVLVVAKIVANFQHFLMIVMHDETQDIDTICNFKSILEKVVRVEELFDSSLVHYDKILRPDMHSDPNFTDFDKSMYSLESALLKKKQEPVEETELKTLWGAIYSKIDKGKVAKNKGTNRRQIMTDKKMKNILGHPKMDDWDLVSQMLQ